MYQNVGRPPYVGTAAIVDNLAAQFSAFPDSYEYRVLSVAAHENIVLTERLDMIRTPTGQLHGVPVMGAFEIRDEKISRWTDYWDSALVAKMLSGEDVSALMPWSCEPHPCTNQ